MTCGSGSGELRGRGVVRRDARSRMALQLDAVGLWSRESSCLSARPFEVCAGQSTPLPHRPPFFFCHISLSSCTRSRSSPAHIVMLDSLLSSRDGFNQLLSLDRPTRPAEPALTAPLSKYGHRRCFPPCELRDMGRRIRCSRKATRLASKIRSRDSRSTFGTPRAPPRTARAACVLRCTMGITDVRPCGDLVLACT